jgi:putative SOS response-associated peptidase YedK
MCGRFTQTQTDPHIIQAQFELAEAPSEGAPRYNVAPTQAILAVLSGGEGRRADYLHWGLIPGWAKERPKSAPLINARAETVAEKPSFRAAFQARRCLILADGFYEWRAESGGGKTPFYIHLEGRPLFAMAGLYEDWRDPSTGQSIRSCAIITTAANALMAPLHHRMPVILPPAAYADWLAPGPGPVALLGQYPAEAMRYYPVSSKVNKIHADDPSLLDPDDSPPPPTTLSLF